MVSDTRTLTFQELLCFVEVCRSGSITAAADALGMAKSAVSKQVSRLEERLGVRLLERSSRRVKLTRAGERLLPRVDSLIADGERLIEQAGEERGHPEGLVRIAATPEFGALVARELFPRAVEQFPKLQLVMSAAYAFEDLQDPAFDLGIRIGRVNDDRLVARCIGGFRRIVVASPAYLAQHPLGSMDDLTHARCIIFSDRKATTTWTLVADDAGNERRIEVSGQLAVRSFATVIELAQAGAGVALVPDFAAADALARGRLVRCLPGVRSPPTLVYVVFRVGGDRVRRVKVILDLATRLLPALLSEPASKLHP